MTQNLTPVGDVVAIRYIPLSQVSKWERNPKLHDMNGLIKALRSYGFQILPKFDHALNEGRGGIVFGNGRIEALTLMFNEGGTPPAGIAVAEDGSWHVPILFGNDLPSQAQAEAFALDHNNLVLAGGGFSAVYMTQIWDEGSYVNLLVELNQAAHLPVTVTEPDLELLMGAVFGDGAETEAKGETRITLGMYTQKIPLTQYLPWANQLSEEFDYQKAEIVTELKKRLGIDLVEERINDDQYEHSTP